MGEMDKRDRQHEQRLKSLRRLAEHRRLDVLLAALTLAVAFLYLLLPEARYGLLVMLFIPVSISAFYMSTLRAAIVGGIVAFAVSLSLATGMTPLWPANHSVQVVTVLAWAVSLGCCSICVSGMSLMQLTAMVRLQENTHCGAHD